MKHMKLFVNIQYFFCRGSSIRILSSSSNTMDKKRTEHIILTAEKSRDPLVLGMYK